MQNSTIKVLLVGISNPKYWVLAGVDPETYRCTDVRLHGCIRGLAAEVRNRFLLR